MKLLPQACITREIRFETRQPGHTLTGQTLASPEAAACCTATIISQAQHYKSVFSANCIRKPVRILSACCSGRIAQTFAASRHWQCLLHSPAVGRTVRILSKISVRTTLAATHCCLAKRGEVLCVRMPEGGAADAATSSVSAVSALTLNPFRA